MRLAILFTALVSTQAAAGKYDGALLDTCNRFAEKRTVTMEGAESAKRYCASVAPQSTMDAIDAKIADLKSKQPAERPQEIEAPAEAAPPPPSREQRITAAKAEAKGQINSCTMRIQVAQDEIAREKRAAAISGYEDARKLHGLGQMIVACHEFQAAARRRIDTLNSNPDAILSIKPPPPVVSFGRRVPIPVE